VTLDLSQARIGGALVFAPARLEHTTDPQARLALDGLTTTAVALALTLGAHGGVARVDPHPPAATQCSAVERVGVGLDLGLPLVKTGIRAHCDTTASTTGQVLTVAGWGLQLLAWAFATLFVAGFTGAVRKT
jgi:hypothetical protein